MSADIILQARNLKKYYGKGETQVHALDGVDLEIEAGKFVAIIGTSGSGKSTLLNMLGGLDNPTSGTVTIGNTELSGLQEEQLTVFRRRCIGFIFQNYNLIPTLNVWENIVFPIAMDRQKPDQKFIEEVVGLLGLEQKIHSLYGHRNRALPPFHNGNPIHRNQCSPQSPLLSDPHAAPSHPDPETAILSTIL